MDGRASQQKDRKSVITSAPGCKRRIPADILEVRVVENRVAYECEASNRFEQSLHRPELKLLMTTSGAFKLRNPLVPDPGQTRGVSYESPRSQKKSPCGGGAKNR